MEEISEQITLLSNRLSETNKSVKEEGILKENIDMDGGKNYEYIYEISFYENKRKVNPHSLTYYKEEKHTRWAYDWDEHDEIFRIKVIKVSPDNNNLDGAISNSKIAEERHEWIEYWDDEKTDYRYIYQMDWFYDKYKSKPLFSCSYAKEEHTRWGHDWSSGLNYAEFCTISVKRVHKDSAEYQMALHFSKLRDEGKDYTESTLKTHKNFIIVDIDAFKTKCSIILNTLSLTEEEIEKILKLNNSSTVIQKDGNNIPNIELEKFIWAIGFFGNRKDYNEIKNRGKMHKKYEEFHESYKDSVCIYEKYVTIDENKVENMINKFGRNKYDSITIIFSDEKDIYCV